MSLKKSEKMLIGYALLSSGLVLFALLGWPQLDAWMASKANVETLEQELKDMDEQKQTMQASIALLEKNTDIPPDIKIKTYTPGTQEQAVKQLLDYVVGMAVDANNKFISLAPVETTPIVPPPAADEKDKEKAEGGAASANDGAKTAEGAEGEEAPAPLMTTFGYELAIRGSYDSIQNFLSAMAHQKELLEISELSVENELNAEATGGDKIVDANYPIRMTAKLRLALQPVDP